MVTLAAEMNPLVIGLLVIVLLVLLVVFAVMFQFVGLYVRAMVSGAHVSFIDLIGMRLRKVPAVVIVNSRIQAMPRRPGRHRRPEMESHVLAGGNVAARHQRHDRRQQGQHRPLLEDRHRHRPGRPRHPRRRADLA